MQVTLLSHTPNPDDVVYMSARCCYDPIDMTDKNYPIVDKDKKEKLINHLYKSGHLSTFEHVNFTFAVNGISRICSHQLVRHRIGNCFSQRSQRYIEMDTTCDMSSVVIPPTITDKKSANDLYQASVLTAISVYKSMLSMGIPKEDARFVLPHSWTTQLSWTVNARALHHFFSLRLCRRAQWEIRELARQVLVIVYDVAPLLFNITGPSCLVEGKCKESNSCGMPFNNMENLMKPFLD